MDDKETVCFTAASVQDNLQAVSEYAYIIDHLQRIPESSYSKLF